MNFFLVIVFLLEMFEEYNAQVSGNFACKDGEEYDICRSSCEQTCDNIRRGIQNNCSQRCIAGCFCRRGLVRADDDTCVPPSECFKYVCGENEEYNDCGLPCARNCTNLNDPIFCTKPCYKGCFCKLDFVRDSRGKCVHPRNCRIDGNMQCPANEEYVNCVNFCNTCFISEYCETPYCTPGCDCKAGYFRNTYGQCITEQQCVAEEYAYQQQCGLNEIYTSCVNPCNDCYSRGRCDEYLFNYCTPGCDCKQGFYRNENGICVPEWNCFRQSQPVCPPGEEYYNCVPTCRVTCDTYNATDFICDASCNKGCFCKKGFVRREDGLCVLPSECPARYSPCPAGEILYQCLPTCNTTCRNLNTPRELCSTECNQGCFCQPGFVRNDDGLCVPPSECPFVCGTNEEFRTCGSACPATCENFRERNGICPQQICLRGCFCKAGFVLGPKGYCIRPRDCPVPTVTPCCSGLRGRSGNITDDEETTVIISTLIVTESPSNSSNEVSATTNSSETNEKREDQTASPERTIATKNPRSAADKTIEILTTTAGKKTEPASLTTNATNTPVTKVMGKQTETTTSCCSGGFQGRSARVTDDEREGSGHVLSTKVTEASLHISSSTDFPVKKSQTTKEKASGQTTTTKWVIAARTPRLESETTTENLKLTDADIKTEPKVTEAPLHISLSTDFAVTKSEAIKEKASGQTTTTTKSVIAARTPRLESETTTEILKLTTAGIKTESSSLTTKT